MIYDFSLILAGVPELTADVSERLFAAGCDDATPHSSSGVTRVHFDREADSLEEAIRSAVAQVQSAGFVTARAEIAGDVLAARN